MKKRMWGISSSTKVEEYEHNMDALRVFNLAAHNHLLGVASKEKWVRAFFSEHTKCDTQVKKIKFSFPLFLFTHLLHVSFIFSV